MNNGCEKSDKKHPKKDEKKGFKEVKRTTTDDIAVSDLIELTKKRNRLPEADTNSEVGEKKKKKKKKRRKTDISFDASSPPAATTTCTSSSSSSSSTTEVMLAASVSTEEEDPFPYLEEDCCETQSVA
jgi:hypothetical protein